jgi:AGZA family xanthine/uracil permease-like MFS transporter
MAIVIPMMLSDAGMDKGSVFTATCVAAIVGCLIMAFVANYPIAVAPGLSLAVYVVYSVILTNGFSWQQAMSAVFASGVLFLVFNLLNIRQVVMRSIPLSMKMSLSAGVGLFLGLIALKNIGFITSSPSHLLQLGDVRAGPVLLCFAGFIATIALAKWRVPGAILLGILITTVLGAAIGDVHMEGVFSTPPSMLPTFFHMDFSHITQWNYWVVIFTLFYVAFFDCTGTLIGVTQGTHLSDKHGNMKNIRRALVADGAATMVAGVIGVTPAGTYLESGAGINAGGRTGLTAVTVAVLFVVTLFFAPLLTTIPSFATAPAILYIACLMTQSMATIPWEDMTEFVPSILTIILMPLTFSIADAIAVGLVLYVLIKVACGRFSCLNPILIFLSILSAVDLFV